MTHERWWIALVTFERLQENDDAILPDWAHGACGWMVALASNEAEAKMRLTRDAKDRSLRVVEIEDQREVLGSNEIEKVDAQLATNLRAIEPGKQTVWGTIHGYEN